MNRNDIEGWLADITRQISTGCGMNHCIIRPPTGMAPNGGCRCSRDQVARQLDNVAQEVREMNASDWMNGKAVEP